jgi:hypothetical protein
VRRAKPRARFLGDWAGINILRVGTAAPADGAARRPYRLAPICKGPPEFPPGGRDAAPSASVVDAGYFETSALPPAPARSRARTARLQMLRLGHADLGIVLL